MSKGIKIKLKLLIISCILFCSSIASAYTAVVTWNTLSTKPTGYYVYYDTQPIAPLKGTGITQGNSPITVTTNTITLTNLSATKSYSIAIAGYYAKTSTLPLIIGPLSTIITIPILPIAITSTTITITITNP